MREKGFSVKTRRFSYAKLNRAFERRLEELHTRSDSAIGDLRNASDIFARFGITKAILFGSHAAHRARPSSDLDVLVFGLDERLQKEVDLHSEDERPGLVHRA